jgi:hypothetical protein
VVAVAPAAVQKVLEVLEALRQGVSALFCGDSPALREACSRAAEVKASALLREMREASPELNPFSQQSVSLPMPGPSTGADEELRMQVGKLLRLVRGGAATREEREEALCFFAGLEAAHLAGEETLATWTSMYGDLRPLFLFAKAVLQDSLGDFVSAKESLLSAALAINSPDRPGPDAVDWVDQALQDRVGLEYALLTGASLDERPYSRHVRFLMAVNYVVNRDAGAPPRSPEELIQDIERAEALARQGMLP